MTDFNINKGKNTIIIKNKGNSNKHISISFSYFSKDYFQDKDYTKLDNPNMVITSKSVQGCLTALVDDVLTCDYATNETGIFLNPNDPFNIKINNDSFDFKNINDFLQTSTLPSDLNTHILQTCTGFPSNESVISILNDSPFSLEIDGRIIKFSDLDDLYKHQDTLENLNLTFKVLNNDNSTVQ